MAAGQRPHFHTALHKSYSDVTQAGSAWRRVRLLTLRMSRTVNILELVILVACVVTRAYWIFQTTKRVLNFWLSNNVCTFMLLYWYDIRDNKVIWIKFGCVKNPKKNTCNLPCFPSLVLVLVNALSDYERDLASVIWFTSLQIRLCHYTYRHLRKYCMFFLYLYITIDTRLLAFTALLNV